MHVYFFEAFPWMSGGSCKYTASSLLISKQINWGWHMLPDTPRLQTQHLTEWNIQYLTPLQHSLSTMDFRTNSANSLPFKGSKFMCGTGWHRLNYQAFQILLIQKDFPGSADRDLGSRQGWLTAEDFSGESGEKSCTVIHNESKQLEHNKYQPSNWKSEQLKES